MGVIEKDQMHSTLSICAILCVIKKRRPFKTTEADWVESHVLFWASKWALSLAHK